MLVYTATPRADGGENGLVLSANGGDIELADQDSRKVLRRRPLNGTTGVYIKGMDGATNDTLVIDFAGRALELRDGIHS